MGQHHGELHNVANGPAADTGSAEGGAIVNSGSSTLTIQMTGTHSKKDCSPTIDYMSCEP